MEAPLAATAGEARRRRFEISRGTALLLGAAIALAKLWLSHSEEICGSATRYDAFWFVRAAKDWYWNAQYDWIAFVRPPAYPLWLAIVDQLGVRQRLAIDLLQLSGFGLLVLGLARIGVPRVICVAAFALASFHPGSFQLNNYTMADPFYAALLPMAVGGMLLMIARRGVVAPLLTGVLLGVLWLTREESVLIALLVAAFIAIWILHERARGDGWLLSLRRVAAPAAMMMASFAALVLIAYAVNDRTFRAYAKSEMSAPSYDGALEALLRIDTSATQRYVPVTSESLARAFEVSPTFARLRPQFDGVAGQGWRTETLNQQGVSGEIGINYLMWALRNAAADAGIHADARKAEKFYNRMAREINEACDARRVECRAVWLSFIGPNLMRNSHHLPASFAGMLGVFVKRYEMTPLRDDELLTPAERAIYDDVTNRRPLETVPSARAATAIKNLLGRTHRFVIFGVAALALGAAVFLGAKRHLRLSDTITAALLLMFFAILSRVGLFTIIDATSWPVAYERFLFPVMPMTSVFLLVLIAQAALAVRRNRID